MGISSLFRSTPVTKLSYDTSLDISHFAKEFIEELKGIKNTAETKGCKVSNMYQKTVNYAKKLSNSAEKGNIKDTQKNLGKLQKHSDALFFATRSTFTRSAIAAANMERKNIEFALFNDKPSTR